MLERPYGGAPIINLDELVADSQHSLSAREPPWTSDPEKPLDDSSPTDV